ncbi:protein piccolo-like [Mesocricetus auratus]|uniref:Protein piccolo-like n=1 Tax=Mesocricetus auratus TaxID=10036 RepID=A0ABM2XDQ3_MESAU|nr:protein piccolo-like [Mesocricetus auratus]
MDTGAAQQHRGQAGQDWERGGGSESAAAPPIPATLLEGTRVKVTGHPLSPDGRPPPARAPPQLTDGHGGSACAVASGVCGGTCLSPPRWREGGRDRGDGPATVLRSHYQRSPWDQSLLHPAHSSPSACSLQEQSKQLLQVGTEEIPAGREEERERTGRQARDSRKAARPAGLLAATEGPAQLPSAAPGVAWQLGWRAVRTEAKGQSGSPGRTICSDGDGSLTSLSSGLWGPSPRQDGRTAQASLSEEPARLNTRRPPQSFWGQALQLSASAAREKRGGPSRHRRQPTPPEPTPPEPTPPEPTPPEPTPPEPTPPEPTPPEPTPPEPLPPEPTPPEPTPPEPTPPEPTPPEPIPPEPTPPELHLLSLHPLSLHLLNLYLLSLHPLSLHPLSYTS